MKQNGHSIFVADESLKKDREVVLTAVTQDAQALSVVDKEFFKR